MNAQPLIAAAAETPGLSDTFPYLVGMLLVLIILSTLWGICAICAKIVAVFLPKEADRPLAATPRAVPASAGDGDRIPSDIVAAIAAAVASTSDGPARIVSIRTDGANWSKAGRQSVLSSHRIR